MASEGMDAPAIGHQIWGPLGKQDVCPNSALTAAKFVFSNSDNFRAKANPPKPISCPKRPLGKMGKNSSADWETSRFVSVPVQNPGRSSRGDSVGLRL